ncbi:Rap1a/Tai family immunity protein [Hoeflea marina]|uniref:Rap1a/Tai family immunity protein n=1 Tax=Hoeflea marina TaxID=274592 RepID=UPI003CC9C8D9
MKVKFVGLCAALLVSHPGTSVARYLTGNDLQELCASSEVGCMSYIMGVVGGVQTNDALVNRSSENRTAALRLCIPAGVSATQLVDIVKKSIDGQPETRHQDAAFLTVLAITRAFPCK